MFRLKKNNMFVYGYKVKKFRRGDRIFFCFFAGAIRFFFLPENAHSCPQQYPFQIDTNHRYNLQVPFLIYLDVIISNGLTSCQQRRWRRWPRRSWAARHHRGIVFGRGGVGGSHSPYERTAQIGIIRGYDKYF